MRSGLSGSSKGSQQDPKIHCCREHFGTVVDHLEFRAMVVSATEVLYVQGQSEQEGQKLIHSRHINGTTRATDKRSYLTVSPLLYDQGTCAKK